MNRSYDKAEWRAPVDLAREADFDLGGLRVRPSLCEIETASGNETVEPRVMQALVAFAQAKGSVLSRDELVQRCWGGRIVSEDAINRCVAKVRKLSELDGGASFVLETIARVGYRLVEVTPVLPDEPLANAGPVASAAASGHAGKALWRARPLWTAAALAIAAVAAIAGFAGGFLSRRPSNEIASTTLAPSAAMAPLSYHGPPDGTSFRDCSEGCPEMVVIPPGRFLMGATYGEHGHSGHESPQHVVTIRYHLAVARYDVTREEYALFASETNRPDGNDHCFTLVRSGRFLESPNASWRDPGFRQTSRDPAVCISWDDAEAYVDWLARKTGKPYRLLTEAEWEYAARAGSASVQPDVPSRLCHAFNGGDADYHARFPGDAAADDECHDGYAQTSPVGRFPPNAFGLFDMLGNASQWVSDCYNQTYDGAPADGSAWTDANCGMRVARGGSWTNDSRDIRFALRLGSYAVGRFSTNGLRVARKM